MSAQRIAVTSELVPLFPFNLLNDVLGLARIPLTHYVLASLVCMAPGTLAYTWLGRSGGDNRKFLEAVLWKVRTNSPWRDLPPELGDWNTVFKRFDYWSKAGVFRRIFEAVSDDPDMEFAMIDATIVPVHRHGHGAKGGLKIRRSANPKAAGRRKSSP